MVETPSHMPAGGLDVENVRRQFPVLHQEVHGKPLVYLDSGATAQIPTPVQEAIQRFSDADRSNIHRGVHALSGRATDAYERARERVRAFIGAAQAREVIFTSGTTASLNLAAHVLGQARLQPGDEILVSEMEHHSNIVPWQLAAQATGAVVRPIPITDTGELDLEAYFAALGPKTKIVAVTQVSNALGTVNPLERVIGAARELGVITVVDGAQAVPHHRVDVQALGCDFYAFSGHKIYGPFGIGVLYGRAELLEGLPPYQGGGGMIRVVSFEGTTFASIPDRYEAGTPNVSGAVGLAAALDFVDSLGLDTIAAHEQALLTYADEALAAVPGLRIIGTSAHKAAVTSFVLDPIHPHDLGTIVDREGVAIRVGHHCAQPVMQHFGIPATARASLGVYNQTSDIDALVSALHRAREIFKL